jgi:hypothetical protein
MESHTKMDTSLIGQFVPRVEQWVKAHKILVWWVGISSAIMFLGTLAVLIIVIVVLPSEHFVRDSENYPTPIENPLLLIFCQVFKNLIGIFLSCLG